MFTLTSGLRTCGQRRSSSSDFGLEWVLQRSCWFYSLCLSGRELRPTRLSLPPLRRSRTVSNNHKGMKEKEKQTHTGADIRPVIGDAHRSVGTETDCQTDATFRWCTPLCSCRGIEAVEPCHLNLRHDLESDLLLPNELAELLAINEIDGGRSGDGGVPGSLGVSP